jgi:hypothetical protein
LENKISNKTFDISSDNDFRKLNLERQQKIFNLYREKLSPLKTPMHLKNQIGVLIQCINSNYGSDRDGIKNRDTVPNYISELYDLCKSFSLVVTDWVQNRKIAVNMSDFSDQAVLKKTLNNIITMYTQDIQQLQHWSLLSSIHILSLSI